MAKVVAAYARLVDGASEVHKAVLARLLREERDRFWRWDDRVERQGT